MKLKLPWKSSLDKNVGGVDSPNSTKVKKDPKLYAWYAEKLHEAMRMHLCTYNRIATNGREVDLPRSVDANIFGQWVDVLFRYWQVNKSPIDGNRVINYKDVYDICREYLSTMNITLNEPSESNADGNA